MPLLTELENIILGLRATNISPLPGAGGNARPASICANPASQRRRRDIFVASPPGKPKSPVRGGIFGAFGFAGGGVIKMPLLTELENIILGLEATNISPLTGLGGAPALQHLPRIQHPSAVGAAYL